MKRILFGVIFLFLLININAQNRIDLFPDDLNIKPFAANTLEPKLGSIFQLSKNELELNIGNSMDIARIANDHGETYSFGADLFTFTLLRGEQNFHFPVDAVDYLFGVNFSYKKVLQDCSIGFRGRISHISAHFVDGHYDGVTQTWRDGLNPRVYSREFFELLGFYEFQHLRVYAGGAYLFHVDPATIKKDNFQIGFDYYAKDFLGDHLTPFIGYDLKLIHLDKYTACNSISAGIKFGNADSKGISLLLNYYSGKSIHGEYFDKNKEYAALGINLDL